MQTCLALRDKDHPRTPVSRLWHKSRLNHRLPHLYLLVPLPPIRMREYENDVPLYAGPQDLPIRMLLPYVVSCTFVKIRKEVRKDLNRSLVGRKGSNVR